MPNASDHYIVLHILLMTIPTNHRIISCFFRFTHGLGVSLGAMHVLYLRHCAWPIKALMVYVRLFAWLLHGRLFREFFSQKFPKNYRCTSNNLACIKRNQVAQVAMGISKGICIVFLYINRNHDDQYLGIPKRRMMSTFHRFFV